MFNLSNIFYDPFFFKLLFVGITTLLFSMFFVSVILKYKHKQYMMGEFLPGDKKLIQPSVVYGVWLVITLFIITCLFCFISKIHFSFNIWMTFIILYLVGMKEDRKELSIFQKLISIILISTLIFNEGIFISNMHGLFGIYKLPIVIAFIHHIFISVIVVFSFNQIRKIEGLAVGLGLINSIIFCILFYLKQDYLFSMISFAVASGLLGFLIFNFHPARIFIGDTGSTVLGLMMLIFSVRIFNSAEVVVFNQIVKSVLIVPALLLIPVYDMIRTGIEINMNRRKNNQPDQKQIHFLLLNSGLKPIKASLILYYANFKLISLSLMMGHWNIYLGLIVLVIMTFAVSESLTLFNIFKNSITVFSFKNKLNTLYDENILLLKLFNESTNTIFTDENK